MHGRQDPTGKSAIARYGSASFEAKHGAAEKLAKEMDFDRYQCATLLRPGEYQMLVVEAPTVPAVELKSAIRWRIKDLLDFHVDDATVDVLDIPPEAGAQPGRNHSMYAIAARNEVIRGCVKTFESARIPLSVIDIPEIAQRNISALHETEGRGAALLYFNNEFGLLTITCGGGSTFPAASRSACSRSLARGLRRASSCSAAWCWSCSAASTTSTGNTISYPSPRCCWGPSRRTQGCSAI